MKGAARRSQVPSAALGAAIVLAACAVPPPEPEPEPVPALGSVSFAVSCSAEAQQEFNQAMALLHHMTYDESRQGFERVARIDPMCGMAHWGVAMTLFQPLWPTRPSAEDLRDGREAVQRAASVGVRSEREEMFLAAASAFFSGDEVDYWDRIRAWERASEGVYSAYPEDHEAAALFALSHLATAPADGAGGSLSHHERVADILSGVYEANPQHPGAVHYTIHANDAAGRELESLGIVRSYGDIAPRNPHALHMPTHIYVRLGEWSDVIEGNVAARDAALEHPAGPRGQWVWDEFPHAVEYLVYGHLQRGDDAAAKLEIDRLMNTAALQPTFKTAFHISSTRARYALERGAWDEAADLDPRPGQGLDWERLWWPEAVTWFARGLGAANTMRLDDARAALTRVEGLQEAAESAGEPAFAANIGVLRAGLQGWIADAEGDVDRAIGHLREAAELERATPKNPVTPAPTLPATEQLGQLLMEVNRYEDALAAFETSLELFPKRFLSLAGAARAAAAAGQPDKARGLYDELLGVAAASSVRPAVHEARTFVTGSR